MKTKFTFYIFVFTFCASTYTPAYTQVNVQDSLALVALYNSTNGPGWTYGHYNWLEGPVSTWYGITVTGDRVTKIDLTKNGLQGNIPPEFGKLSSLRRLYLSDNQLTSLPPELGNLSSLKELNLYSNKFTSLPPEIGNLSSLGNLRLYSNQLTNLPPEIGNLSGLQNLDLNSNQLISIPPEIGNLSSLLHLDLNSNQLTSLPPEIGNLSGLQDLVLADNQLTSLPPDFGNLSGLYNLSLQYNQLTSLPPEFGNLSGLYNLSLQYNQLTSLPPEFGNLSSLQYLDLEYNQLTSLPPEFGNLSSLLILYLSNNQLTSLPPEFGNLSDLYKLSLSGNLLTSLPPEIGNLSSLQDLYLNDNQLRSLSPEIGNLSVLYNLSLYNNQLTNLPSEIGNLSSLVILELSYNQLTSLPPEIGNLSNIYHLVLNNNQLANLPPEIGNLSSVYYLYLGNNQLTSLPPEIGNLSGFQVLYLEYNYLTFDLEAIVNKFPYASYIPQANIPLHQNSNALSVSAGGTLSNNTYQWFSVEQGALTTIAGDSVFHPSESGQYYAAVTNSICTQLTLYTDTIYYDAVLPVTIIDLKGYQQKSIIKVDWASVTEINLAKYEIQRSSNSYGFTTIGALAAKGNGTLQTNYSFNDLQPLQGNNYYRLKIYDKDGSTTYSKTVLVNVSSDKTFTTVYPVPAKNLLYVKTNGSNPFALLEQSGKILFTTNINENGIIDVTRFAAGLYYLKNNHTGEVHKIVITK